MSKAVITVTGVKPKHINAMQDALKELGVEVIDLRIFRDSTATEVSTV